MKKIISMIILAFFCSMLTAEDAKIVDTESETTAESNPSVTDNNTISDEELLEALGTDMDQYGLPEGIYQYDPLLLQLKYSIKNTETTDVLYMTFGGIFIVGGAALAIAAPELVWAPYGAKTNIPYGYFMVGLGGGFIIFDLITVKPSIKDQTNHLKKEFNDSYGEYLSD